MNPSAATPIRATQAENSVQAALLKDLMRRAFSGSAVTLDAARARR